MEKTIDLTTLKDDLRADLEKQQRITAFFAVASIAEGILLLCFGIGQMFFER